MFAFVKSPQKRQFNPRKTLRLIAIIAVVLALVGMSLSAFAQSANTFNFLNGVESKFQPLQQTWYTKISVYAQRLFWALAAVDFGWTTITYIIDKNDIADMLGSVVRKVMTISFFFVLLKMSNQWIPMIIDSFTQIGQDAGGMTTSTTPDGIVGKGFDLALGAFKAIHDLGALDAIAVVLPVGCLGIVMFLAFLFVAAQLLVTQIESFLCIGAGVILLGFGGSRWTTDMASKYMQYAVATGLKLMVLYLIVGAGQSLFSGLTIDPNNLIASCLTNAGSALVYTYLAIQIPAIASAMMSGSPTMTAGGMMGAALSAGAAVAGVGAAVAGGAMGAAKGASGAAAGATGLAKALSSGVNSGLDLGKSGTDLATHALGQMGSHGLGMAKGAVGDAVGGARTSFAQKVDGSAGGKIASSIESTRGGSMSGVPAPAPAQAPAPQGGTGAPASSGSGGNQATGGGSSGSSTAAEQVNGSNAPMDSTGSSATPGAPLSAASTGGDGAAQATPGGASADMSGSPLSAPSSASQGASGAPQSPPQATASSSAGAPNLGASNGGGNAPTGSAAAPSGGSGPSSDATTASAGAGNTPVTPSSNPSGDASTASVSGGGSGAQAPQAPQPRKDALHSRIQNLQGYVPQDGAAAASINIDLKHAAD